MLIRLAPRPATYSDLRRWYRLCSGAACDGIGMRPSTAVQILIGRADRIRGDSQDAIECAERVEASVKAEDELVEIGFGDAAGLRHDEFKKPCLQVAEDKVNPWEGAPQRHRDCRPSPRDDERSQVAQDHHSLASRRSVSAYRALLAPQ